MLINLRNLGPSLATLAQSSWSLLSNTLGGRIASKTLLWWWDFWSMWVLCFTWYNCIIEWVLKSFYLFFFVWCHFVFVFCSSKIFHTCSSFILFNIYFYIWFCLVWRLNSIELTLCLSKLGVPGFHFLNILKISTKFLPFLISLYLSLPICFLNPFLYLVVKEDEKTRFIQRNVGINLKFDANNLRVLYSW